jgi:uncharacterized protein
MTVKKAIIRCPIHGSVTLSEREIAIVNNRFFQRLRYISQLGFTALVFPGAVHTRFSHAIGTMHLAGRIFDQVVNDGVGRLRTYYDSDQLAYYRCILRWAALLHDTGHPPFSHAAESLLPPLSALDLPETLRPVEERRSTHEDFSHLIIHHLAADEGLLSAAEAEDIISILARDRVPSPRLNARSGGPMIHPLLCQIINGEIDVDRMDYLLRDSYFAGVPYGKFDLDRLVSSFSCCLAAPLNQFLLSIDGEGVPSYEIFLLARIHMFYQIYFHKSLGAYRYYLTKASEEGEIDWRIDGSLENFVDLTESGLLEEFKRNRNRKWSGRIFHRVPAKNLIRVFDGEHEQMRKLVAVRELLQAQSVEVIESYSANQYSSQIKNQEIDRQTVLVREEEFGTQTIVPLAQRSSLLGDRPRMIEITQLYVHREDYERAITMIQRHRP